MWKQLACVSCAVGLLMAGVVAPVRAADDQAEWANRIRFLVSSGIDSSGIINALTFRSGPGRTGWNWQLAASYPLKEPFFVEGGLMGWTLGRSNMGDAKRFGITASGGVNLSGGMTEAGLGLVPSGTRIFARHFFGDIPGRGGMVQGSLVFPSTTGTRSFLELSLGYGF